MSPYTHLRRIMYINHEDSEEHFSDFKRALECVAPAIELYYLPGCDYSHFGAGSLVPDLIFLDLKFSHKEEFHCLKDIRNSGYAGVPVILYAAGGNEAYRKPAYQGGASLFVTRPASFEELLACLEKILEKTDWQPPSAGTSSHAGCGKHLAFEED